jgi:MarR family transcriptional regulator, 2-MHQ and catechol-resistance regulon repressor
MGTRYRGTPAEVRALDTYIKLMRAADSVSRRLDPRLLRDGLTETQFGVLETLFHLGPLSQRAIAAKQLTSASNLTTVIDNLERDGLATRRRDPDDRRATIVDLTPRARALIRTVFPGHVAAIVQEFAVLTAAEQAELGRLCKRVGLRSPTAPRSLPTASGRLRRGGQKRSRLGSQSDRAGM